MTPPLPLTAAFCRGNLAVALFLRRSFGRVNGGVPPALKMRVFRIRRPQPWAGAFRSGAGDWQDGDLRLIWDLLLSHRRSVGFVFFLCSSLGGLLWKEVLLVPASHSSPRFLALAANQNRTLIAKRHLAEPNAELDTQASCDQALS